MSTANESQSFAEVFKDYIALQQRTSAVIAAYEAFVAAQGMLDERAAAWLGRQRQMTAEERWWFDDSAPESLSDRVMEDLVRKARKAVDKARDEVLAAVAALAGRKG